MRTKWKKKREEKEKKIQISNAENTCKPMNGDCMTAWFNAKHHAALFFYFNDLKNGNRRQIKRNNWNPTRQEKRSEWEREKYFLKKIDKNYMP